MQTFHNEILQQRRAAPPGARLAPVEQIRGGSEGDFMNS